MLERVSSLSLPPPEKRGMLFPGRRRGGCGTLLIRGRAWNAGGVEPRWRVGLFQRFQPPDWPGGARWPPRAAETWPSWLFFHFSCALLVPGQERRGPLLASNKKTPALPENPLHEIYCRDIYIYSHPLDARLFCLSLLTFFSSLVPFSLVRVVPPGESGREGKCN